MENRSGTRFLFDTYGPKWLVFEMESKYMRRCEKIHRHIFSKMRGLFQISAYL